MLHIRARRRRVSSLCGNLNRTSQIRMPAPFSATWPGHLSVLPVKLCSRVTWTAGRPVSSPSLFRTHRSLCLSRQIFSVSRLVSSKRHTYCGSISQCPSASQSDLWLMESKAFMKSTVEIHILTLHSWHFCSAIFNPAKWSSVWNDRLNPPFFFWLHTVESRTQPIAQKRRKEVVKRWQSAYWHVVSCLFHISPFVNHFYANYSPSRWCAILLFSISLKICLVISFVFSLDASMSSARTPVQSLALPFF